LFPFFFFFFCGILHAKIRLLRVGFLHEKAELRVAHPGVTETFRALAKEPVPLQQLRSALPNVRIRVHIRRENLLPGRDQALNDHCAFNQSEKETTK
jgi:hypothetical protein